MTSHAWADRAISAAEAVALITSGARVFVHGAAATPVPLLDALAARTDLADVRLYHLHTTGTASFLAPAVSPWLRSVSFFVGPDARAAVADGRAGSPSGRRCRSRSCGRASRRTPGRSDRAPAPS